MCLGDIPVSYLRFTYVEIKWFTSSDCLNFCHRGDLLHAPNLIRVMVTSLVWHLHAAELHLDRLVKSMLRVPKVGKFLISFPYPDNQRLLQFPFHVGHAHPIAATAQDSTFHYWLRWLLAHFDYAELHTQVVILNTDIFPHMSWSWKGTRMQDKHSNAYYEPKTEFF